MSVCVCCARERQSERAKVGSECVHIFAEIMEGKCCAGPKNEKEEQDGVCFFVCVCSCVCSLCINQEGGEEEMKNKQKSRNMRRRQ